MRMAWMKHCQHRLTQAYLGRYETKTGAWREKNTRFIDLVVFLASIRSFVLSFGRVHERNDWFSGRTIIKHEI